MPLENIVMIVKLYIAISGLIASLMLGEMCYAQHGNYHKSTISPCDSVLSANSLNSERIEKKFGGYGIDVLYNSATLRVSNLYDAKKITRTLAIVDYPKVIDSSFSKEHQMIVQGGSIGSVFKTHGWKIEKQNIFLGEFYPSTNYSRLYALMGNIPPSTLSIWIYVFYIRKNEKTFPYAIISEIYHPDYLSLTDLKCINKDANVYLKRTKSVNRELKKVTKLMRLHFENGLYMQSVNG